MRFFIKALVRFLLFIVIALTVLTVGINVYLHYSGIKERLVQQAEVALGKPVQMEGLTFNPWAGLHLQNMMVIDTSHAVALKALSLSFDMPGIVRALSNHHVWHGQVCIKKIILNDHLFLKNVRADVSKTDEKISINPFFAKILGGKIQGAMMIQKAAQGSLPYQCTAEFFGIPLTECLARTELQNKIIAGTLQGVINLTGDFEKPELQQGSGTFEVVEAQLKSADFFGSLSLLFPVEELQTLKLHEAKASYIIAADHLDITSVRFRSENLLLTAQGTISFGGLFDLDAQLLLNEKLQKRLKGMLPASLAPSSEPGYQQIPFKISGSGAHLQTDFWNKIGGQQLQNNLGGLLQGLLNSAVRQSSPSPSPSK